jgi:hypothetical protein
MRTRRARVPGSWRGQTTRLVCAIRGENAVQKVSRWALNDASQLSRGCRAAHRAVRRTATCAGAPQRGALEQSLSFGSALYGLSFVQHQPEMSAVISAADVAGLALLLKESAFAVGVLAASALRRAVQLIACKLEPARAAQALREPCDAAATTDAGDSKNVRRERRRHDVARNMAAALEQCPQAFAKVNVRRTVTSADGCNAPTLLPHVPSSACPVLWQAANVRPCRKSRAFRADIFVSCSILYVVWVYQIGVCYMLYVSYIYVISHWFPATLRPRRSRGISEGGTRRQSGSLTRCTHTKLTPHGHNPHAFRTCTRTCASVDPDCALADPTTSCLAATCLCTLNY